MDRIERLKTMVEKNPQDSFPLYGLAMEYRKREEYDSAVAIFRRLLQQQPDYTAAYFHLGMTLRALGQASEATEVFQKGIEITGARGESHAQEELRAALAELGEG